MLIEEGSGDIAGVDVDSVMSDIDNADTYEIPMTAAPDKPAQETQAQTFAHEYVLKGKDGEFKLPYNDPRAQQWLQQGRDYAQNQAQLKAEQERIRSLQETYAPVDEWATKNPEQWQRFMQSFTQFQANPDAYQPQAGATGSEDLIAQGMDPSNPLVQRIAQLEQQFQAQLHPVAKSVQDLMHEKATQKANEEDRQLEAEIESIRNTYADIDWNTPNAEGKSLEMQVLEHATGKGIKNFGAAFRDFYHDNLIKRAEERGKEAVSKDLQKRTRLGLIDQGQSPKRGLTEVKNIKSKSYDDLTNEALAELGLA